MLLRVMFAKRVPVRYISHLELMGTLRRAFRRAELPVAYSRGFNPHQLLSMGQPLPVGMTGSGEFFDLELTEKIKPFEFVDKVNQKLPAGIELIEAREVSQGIKSLMAAVNAAVYSIKMELTSDIDEKGVISDILERDELIVMRHRRNKKDRKINVREMLFDLDIIKSGKWQFVVQTGSSGNLRPEEIIRALDNHYSEIKEVPLINVVREGLYVKMGKELYQLFDDKVIM